MALPICPNCAQGYELSGEPSGSIQKDYQGAYFAPAPPSSLGERGEETSRAVVFLTDGFGLPLKNCKIMADQFAAQLGCDVWVPDIFNGKPLLPLDAIIPDRVDQKLSTWDLIKFIVTTVLPNIGAMIRSRPSVVETRVASFFTLLKEKRGYDKVGLVGYCFGGTIAIRVASTDFIDTVVVCQPGAFTVEQVRAMKVPSSWVCPEVDHFLSHQIRLDAEATFASKKDTPQFVEYEFTDYPGTVHGFACRPNMQYPNVVEAHGKAFEQAVNWFRKTL